jgi:hypothetical protein
VGYWGAQKPDPGLRCPLDRTHPLARGLWGAWIFNRPVGKYWDDAVTSRLISLVDPTYVRRGLYLPYSMSRYGAIEGSPPDPSQGFTIATRARNDASGERQHHLVSRWPAWGIVLDTRTSLPGLYGQMKFGTIENKASFIPSGAVYPGRIMSLALVYDPPAGELRTYLDATHEEDDYPIGTVANEGSMMLGTNGQAADDSTYRWVGQIDYLYIYVRAIDEDEVLWLYREPYDMFQAPEPVRFYSFASMQ